MKLDALIKNKVIQPTLVATEDFERQMKLIERDLREAKNDKIGPAWRYIIAFNALAGMSRLVLLLQGLKSTGLYGTSVSINLMVHFANTKLNLPSKDVLDQFRARRNDFMYRVAGEPDEGELEALVSLVDEIYSKILASPWRHHPYSQCTFGLSLLSTKYWRAS